MQSKESGVEGYGDEIKERGAAHVRVMWLTDTKGPVETSFSPRNWNPRSQVHCSLNYLWLGKGGQIYSLVPLSLSFCLTGISAPLRFWVVRMRARVPRLPQQEAKGGDQLSETQPARGEVLLD